MFTADAFTLHYGNQFQIKVNMLVQNVDKSLLLNLLQREMQCSPRSRFGMLVRRIKDAAYADFANFDVKIGCHGNVP